MACGMLCSQSTYMWMHVFQINIRDKKEREHIFTVHIAQVYFLYACHVHLCVLPVLVLVYMCIHCMYFMSGILE